MIWWLLLAWVLIGPPIAVYLAGRARPKGGGR